MVIMKPQVPKIRDAGFFFKISRQKSEMVKYGTLFILP